MGLTVYWTPFAENKLEDIFSYYNTNASLKVAQRFVNEIIDKSIELKKNPFIGQKELLIEDRIQISSLQKSQNHLLYKSRQKKD